MIENMFEAGLHFGYSKSSAHPSVSPFLYGNKDGVSIFDLEKTEHQLAEAKKFISEATTGGKVIFVGTKNEARGLIKEAAQSVGMPHVTTRWIGGTITNFSEIKKRIGKLEKMLADRERGEFGKFNKKEQLLLDRQIAKLQKYYEGLMGMTELPKAIIVVDSKAEAVAVKEAQDRSIPVIALSNSDCDISAISHPIPGNDAARASIELVLKELAGAITKAN